MDIGYVQGMNYLAGSVAFHCAHERNVLLVLNFLFENLEIRKVYNFNTFETHLAVIKMLLKCHLLRHQPIPNEPLCQPYLQKKKKLV